ncbi:MAG: right-handed parallel beta-helix repeat-containing protein [Bacteroidales bacterium]|nr:right-handed parallel beta-helix repeat-containing protein [Bacteroidales bacterium]
MKTNVLVTFSFWKKVMAGIFFLMISGHLTLQGQVQFPQTTNADFYKGSYNDLLVGSDNVYLPFQATAVGTWLTTTILPQTLMGHKAATWNNRYVYVVGGYNDATYSNAVYRATLQSGGISGYTTLNPLPVGLRDHAVVIGSNTIYVLGGRDDTNLYNTIYYATINTDGSIGPWQTSAVTLPVPLWGHTAVYCNGYIYVAGGAHNTSATTARNAVYYAKVLADNTLSAFSNGTNLPAPRNGHSMVVHGDKVYALGGFTLGGGKANTVYHATSGNNGALGVWTTATALPIQVSNHSSVAINGIITVLAGESGGTLKNTVYWADVTTSPLVWTLAPDVMYDYTKDGAAFASNGQIGYCGGENLSGAPIHNTRYANLTLSPTNLKKAGLFVSNPFYELGAERLISQLTFTAATPAGAAVSVQYRVAGNDLVWGDWTAATSTSPITVNQTKQYLQFKVNFTSNAIAAPVFSDLTLFTPGTQLAGNLNAIPTFTQAASPYWATSDISFTAGTHTFQAGTIIVFLPGVTMTVGQANIICSGTVADSVKFVGYTNNPGLWNGIYFNPDSDNGVSSQFNYTVITNAGNGGNSANLYCNGSNEPLINNSSIRNSSTNGIRLNGSHINLQNSVVRNNGTNGVYLENSNPTFVSCNMNANGAAGIYYTSSTSTPTYASTTCQNNLYGLHFPSPNFTIYPPDGTLTLTGNTYNGICINEGDVGNNQRWYSVAYDYIMLGNVRIGQINGICRLTIEPGNRIKFLPGKGMQIGFYLSGWNHGGELYSIGTADSLVTFTPLNGTAGGWEGIYFENLSDWNGATSVLNHCVVEKGNNYNIYFENTNSPSLGNCQIKNALLDGLKFNNAYNSVSSSSITNNGRYPVYISEVNTIPTMVGNTYSGNAINLIGYCGGSLSENRTFFNDGINYHILDDIKIGKINDVRRLTISPGLTLFFADGKGIQVGYYLSGWNHGGELYAIGNAANLITFTPYSGTEGNWNGIYFEDRSDWNGSTNQLKYCVVEKSNDYNIYCENTNSVSIENCTLRNAVTDGIRYYQSHGAYNTNTFSNNGRYPVYYTNWWSSPTHANNTFTANGVNQIALSGGNFTESRTITKDNAEYLLLDNILIGRINEVCRLTIEPGVILNFNSGKSIQMGYYLSGWNYGGELHAPGTSDNRIIFRPASGIAGDWSGLYFEDRSDWAGATSLLSYCTIEKGNLYNIYAENTTQPVLENCVLSDATETGLKLMNSTLTIKKSSFINNGAYGMYLDGSSSATIGNTAEFTCNFYHNAGTHELYNNTANNINARYNFWGTADSAMIASRIYDKYDNSAKGIVYFGNFAQLPVLPTPTTAMSGWVKYANPGSNPMKNAAMAIKDFGGTAIASTTTNLLGNYTFAPFTSGNYQMTITPSNAWGGGNGTDALKILRHFAQLETLTGMKLAAADVNKSSTVNGTDALFIMKRFATLINSFPSGDYLWHTESLTINGNQITNNIKMLCFGDVDASYAPAKKDDPLVHIIYNGSVTIGSFTEFDVPVKLKDGMKVGAISLGFTYPEEYFEVLGVELMNGSQSYLFNASDGLAKIAWCDLNAMSVSNDEVMLTLKMKSLDLQGLNYNVQLGIDESCELADESANPIPSWIEIPEIIHQTTGIGNDKPGDPFIVYPNPMAANQPLHITLQAESSVRISIINEIGQQVKEIAETNMATGNHEIVIDKNLLEAGIYFLKIEVQQPNFTGSKVIKMVVTE